jgi:predicted  nucleic acid-binding Zn-ribbon protein
MPTQPKQPLKATLLKLFVIDNEGEYSGEYAVDEDCTVEFGDCLRALGDTPMEDMQTIFMGPMRLTMLAGTNFNLIAISKGPLGSQEITWAKATLTTTEAVFSRALEDRRKPLAEDAALATELKAVKVKLGEVESQLEVERSKAEQEARTLRSQVTQLEEKVGRADGLERQLAVMAAREEQLRREMQLKQDSMRNVETTISRAIEREEQLRRQYDSIKAENEDLKSSVASVEMAKKEVEGRMNLIQRKAMELLEKEENLRMREQTLRTIPAQGSTREQDGPIRSGYERA